MISYEALLSTVHPGQRELTYAELREIYETYHRDGWRLISVAFLLGFQRGKRAGKEGK